MLAAGERVDAEDRLEQLGAAGALKAGDADDLAGAEREVDAVDVPVAGAAELEPRLTDLGAGSGSGKNDEIGRPTIRRTSAASSSSAAGRVATRRPSLRTVIVSQRSKISLSRWET